MSGFKVFSSLDDVPKAPQFDLIVLFDALEHISAEQLVTFTKSLRDRLTSEGAFLLRVPNGDSPFGRLHQHGDMTHVTTFGKFKLQQLAVLCGLKLVACGESPWNAQQHEKRTLRAWVRAALRSCLSRLMGFAYFGGKIDFSTNLTAVLVANTPAPSTKVRPLTGQF